MNNKWNSIKDTLKVGNEITGTVVSTQPFGVFLNIGFKIEDGFKYSGIIDLLPIENPDIKKLPKDYSLWPKVNDRVKCLIMGFRENSFEIELGYLTIINE